MPIVLENPLKFVSHRVNFLHVERCLLMVGTKPAHHHYYKNALQWSRNQQEVTKQSVWVHGLHNPSPWIHEYPPSRRELAQAPNRQAADKNEASAFVALLRACTKNKDLCQGTHAHDDILRRGLVSLCSDALVIMYAKCGALTKAKDLLDRSTSRSVFTWTAVISGFVQMGQGQIALDYFDSMQAEGLSPDNVTYTCALKACGSIQAADKGKQIHDEIVKQGFLSNHVKLGNTLINMYAKCGALTKARQVLEELPTRNSVTWNALIAGYVDQGEGKKALHCFEEMQFEGLPPDAVTFICLLKACGSIRAFDKGKELHDKIDKQGLLKKDLVLGNALVDMYVKCGALHRAREVSDGLSSRDVITWNALIAGYAQKGEGEEALNCYELMQGEGFSPNDVTFICVLKACGNTGAVNKGEEIHDQIAKQGLLQTNLPLGTALVDMYAKCGALAKGRQVLDDLSIRNAIAWSALIAGYAEHGEGTQAVSCFEGMLREGLSPDAVTFISVLKACGSIGATDKGEFIHNEIAKQGLLQKDVVLGTALVDMYVKCGALNRAREVFMELSTRDAISWSALITGYAEHEENDQAFKCFEQMQHEGLSPDAVTYIGILRACGSMGAADMGERVYDAIAKQGLLENDMILGTALVDMYAKCGALGKARQVFEELPVRNVVSWSALIAGYVQQGEGEQALDCFKKMQEEGPSPDAATYLSVLSACSRLGLVENAQMYLGSMSTRHGMIPGSEHYSCLVDLFGRAGHLDEAMQVIEEMPSFKSGAWSAILAACQNWGDVSVGRWAFKHAVQINKTDAAYYDIMAHIYAATGLYKDAENSKAVRKENQTWKDPDKTEKLIVANVSCSPPQYGYSSSGHQGL